MFTVPSMYLGLSANKLSRIATELEQKNTALTAMNVHLQKELEAEHALAETLGHDCERLKDENTSLRELVRDMWSGMCGYAHDCRNCEHYELYEGQSFVGKCEYYRRMCELGIEVKI